MPQEGSIIISIGSNDTAKIKNIATEKRLDALEKQLNLQYKLFQNGKSNIQPYDEIIKVFRKSIYEKMNKAVSNNLEKAFESMLLRLEKAILKARPRLTPMPM